MRTDRDRIAGPKVVWNVVELELPKLKPVVEAAIAALDANH